MLHTKSRPSGSGCIFNGASSIQSHLPFERKIQIMVMRFSKTSSILTENKSNKYLPRILYEFLYIIVFNSEQVLKLLNRMTWKNCYHKDQV